MTQKLTPKQEKFCQAYIETGNASEAYRRAYKTENMKAETINRNAKALLDNTKIATRTAELLEGHRQRHDVTVDGLTDELEMTRFWAMVGGNQNAAVSAIMGKAKLHGLLVDKKEHGGPGGGPIETVVTDLRALTDEQLEKELAQVRKRQAELT